MPDIAQVALRIPIVELWARRGQIVYGRARQADDAPLGPAVDGQESDGLAWVLGVTFFFLFVVAVVKAFACGSNPTALGLTGSGWGWILILALFLPLVGQVLVVLFLLAGTCLP